MINKKSFNKLCFLRNTKSEMKKMNHAPFNIAYQNAIHEDPFRESIGKEKTGIWLKKSLCKDYFRDFHDTKNCKACKKKNWVLWYKSYKRNCRIQFCTCCIEDKAPESRIRKKQKFCVEIKNQLEQEIEESNEIHSLLSNLQEVVHINPQEDYYYAIKDFW